MLQTPRRFTLVAGSGEGDTTLTAFDKALLMAGVGNLNLLRSPVFFPGAEYSHQVEITPGLLLQLLWCY